MCLPWLRLMCRRLALLPYLLHNRHCHHMLLILYPTTHLTKPNTPCPHLTSHCFLLCFSFFSRAQVQRRHRLCMARDLSEHDIVARVMRKENYLVGMLNKVREAAGA